jgi:hypothetical protein
VADVIYLGLVVAFFAATFWLVRFCERIGQRGKP